jgi:hypothetical protein
MYKSPSNAQMQQVKKNLIKHTYSSVDSAKIIHKHYGFQLLHVNSRKSVFLKSSPLPVCLNYLRCKINRKVNDHKSWWIKRCTIIYKFEFCSSFLLFYQIVLQQMKGPTCSVIWICNQILVKNSQTYCMAWLSYIICPTMTLSWTFNYK